MSNDTSPIDTLPGSMQEIAQLIGYRAAIALVERWGGMRLYVPERIDAEHPIAQTIGLGAARKLASLYQRTEIPVPRCVRWLIAGRNAKVREDYAAGISAPRLARRELLTERMVRYIISAESIQSPQQELL